VTIVSGTRLGPYEIVAPIGAGGMGEVYRARDTRLDRQVAVKILPAEFAQNAQFKLRFAREAKTISQLSHPNICTLYDVGENYIVMELLDGDSLADRLIKGPLPLREVLKYGVQIAEALGKAHREGIVHRDLKPGNIMLTKAGAKLLDFGLAKGGAPPASAESEATVQKPLTQEGYVLGTYQYMAPEQLAGEEPDARADIFAFGAVLYEMATGKRAFEGKTKTSLIAAIVSGDPKPMMELQPLTPAALEHVVKKCLAKDREDRWQSASDIAEELRWISEAGSQAGVSPPIVRRRTMFRRVAAAMILAIAGGFLGWQLHTPRAPSRTESEIAPPEGIDFSYISGPMALSPDGGMLVFAARDAQGHTMLWLRRLDGSAARPIAGTENGSVPFWSPDGRYLGFFSEGKLRKVGLRGGAPDVLADAPRPLGGTWNRDGDILFAPQFDSPLWRVSAAGGKATKVTRDRRIAPCFLPDGRHFLSTSYKAYGESDGVYVGSLDTEKETLILPQLYSSAAYVAPGFLLYSKDGDLRAQRFDTRNMRVEGDSIRLAERVQLDSGHGNLALFAVSQSGTLTYLPGGTAGLTQLTWVTRDGKVSGTLGPPGHFYTPRISHDGKRVAVDLSDPVTNRGDIWIFDLKRNIATRATYDPTNETGALWLKNDQRFVFMSEKLGQADLYEHVADGSQVDTLLFASKLRKMPADISPDDQSVIFQSLSQDQYDLFVLSRKDRRVTPWLATRFNELGAQFSPDGRWILYQSDESGQWEVYVRRFADPEEKYLISTGGGSMTSWRNDGREIFYISPDRKMMVVPVKLDPAFDIGEARSLFEARVKTEDLLTSRQYDTRNGEHFLLNLAVGEQGSKPMTLVQNWTEGISR
jgi:serine/threonine protein kinase